MNLNSTIEFRFVGNGFGASLGFGKLYCCRDEIA